jgi:two-component system alkaline phosphatase synthesis response regulator PhoP
MGDGTSKKFIIVAEDNKLIAKVLSNKLTAAGYEVVVAYDGDEALRAIAARMPDLLLMDLIMPVKDGFVTLQELRANPATQTLKVVITSDLKQPEDVEKIQKLGVLGFFDKANTQAIVDKVPEFIEAHA